MNISHSCQGQSVKKKKKYKEKLCLHPQHWLQKWTIVNISTSIYEGGSCADAHYEGRRLGEFMMGWVYLCNTRGWRVKLCFYCFISNIETCHYAEIPYPTLKAICEHDPEMLLYSLVWSSFKMYWGKVESGPVITWIKIWNSLWKRWMLCPLDSKGAEVVWILPVLISHFGISDCSMISDCIDHQKRL